MLERVWRARDRVRRLGEGDVITNADQADADGTTEACDACPRRRERRSAHSAFRAVACELAHLSGAVEAETTLGATPSPLLALLDKARAREQAAETSCVDGDPRW